MRSQVSSCMPRPARPRRRLPGEALPPDTALVIMTAGAAAWLADRLPQRPDILTAVMRP